MTQSADPSPPPSGVTVRPKVFFLAFLLLLFKPMLCVDAGEPMVLAWRDNFIPLAPGRHSLRCYVPYLFYRQMGSSTLEIDVPVGGSPSVQWRTPWLVFLQGTWKVTSPS